MAKTTSLDVFDIFKGFKCFKALSKPMGLAVGLVRLLAPLHVHMYLDLDLGMREGLQLHYLNILLSSPCGVHCRSPSPCFTPHSLQGLLTISSCGESSEDTGSLTILMWIRCTMSQVGMDVAS